MTAPEPAPTQDVATVTLRDYVDIQFHLLQAEIDRRFVAELRAVEAAGAAMERRLDSMNEFRAQFADTISRFEPREYAESQREALRERIEKVEAEQSKARGRISAYAVIVAVAGVLLAVFGFAFEHLAR
jgi:hypothetical protein